MQEFVLAKILYPGAEKCSARKISPIFYILANPNPNPAGPNTPQYGNYPQNVSQLAEVEKEKKVYDLSLVSSYRM